MSITSSRTVQVEFSGDVSASVIQSALDNDSAAAETDVISLVLGANTITAPAVSGLVVTGLLIIPPSGNTTQLTLKGVAGDTGIPLHLTDPTSLALGAGFTSLVLNSAAAISGLRLVWS